jgi:hypothetical protein
MKLRAPSAMLGAVLLTAVFQGADTGAPLESTRQELRKLNGNQKADSGPSATEGLRPNLPSIQTPGQESLSPLQLMDPEKLEKERKRQKQERKNWLVNGVEQLERKDKEKTADAFSTEEATTDGSDTRALDGSDLLKLYDEQKKLEEVHKIETKSQRSAPSDPLAPFLQGWLGNSPVRGQFFDEFARKPGGTISGEGPSGVASVNSNRDFGMGPLALTNSGNDLPAKPNPYLVELNRPVQSEPVANTLSVQNALNPGVPIPSFSKPLMSPTPPPAEMRPPERKPLPTPLADDRKYFPQLKKF